MLTMRLQRLSKLQRQAGLDCVILMPGPNLRYLSGLTLFMSERPIVAFFPVDRHPAVLLPVLEQGRAEAMAGPGVEWFPYSDEDGYEGAFARVVDALGLDGKRVAVEYLHMRVLELRSLESVAPQARFISLEQVLPGLRSIKDEREVETIRQAIVMTETALQTLISRPLIGLTERQIADRLSQEMIHAGGDGIGFVIVVAGPNGADPHAGPSDRVVQSGEFLTIDCGLYHDGYLSDITRTFALGPVRDELVEIYELVRRSNAAGKAAVMPGVAAQAVDRAARKVIDDGGYGACFFHRTGHGLGMEDHEPPYVVEGSEQPLEPGMVLTIEPGIYVSGVGGVRIEDDLVVTEDGSECLTTFPRELTMIS